MSTIEDDRYYTDYEDPILPSQTDQGWLQFDNPATPERLLDDIGNIAAGKWLLYRAPEAIDDLWPQLKESVQAGRLGISMKASTPVTGVQEAAGLICVYTKDWRDIADIRRVVAGLRALGITDRLYYKADAQTLIGISGSVYCSPRDTVIELTKKGIAWYHDMDIPVSSVLESLQEE